MCAYRSHGNFALRKLLQSIVTSFRDSKMTSVRYLVLGWVLESLSGEVRGVPDFIEQRAALLPLAYDVASLPADILSTYEKPEVFYQVAGVFI